MACDRMLICCSSPPAALLRESDESYLLPSAFRLRLLPAMPQECAVWLQAAARAPSIVFLDEMDGVLPARSAGSDPGAQIYASVVSTLLALMDGMSDRGDVIVVGATNYNVGVMWLERFSVLQGL